jgi:hypothetical protein
MSSTSKTSGKCHCEGKLFFIRLANFLTDEKSILRQLFSQVLFVWYVSYVIGYNSLNTTLMRKIAYGWAETALNGFVADKMFGWNAS